MSVDPEAVQVRAHGRSLKRLGAWTTARRFDVRASRSLAVIDDGDLRRVGRGRVKGQVREAHRAGRLRPAYR